jgi:hypothetical protein
MKPPVDIRFADLIPLASEHRQNYLLALTHSLSFFSLWGKKHPLVLLTIGTMPLFIKPSC